MNQTLLTIIVHPRKSEFGFSKQDEWSDAWHVHVSAAPQNNEANSEILSECAKLFAAPVSIVRGKKSARKILRIDLSRERVEQILRTAVDYNTQKS